MGIMSDALTNLARKATSGERTPVRRFLNGLKESTVFVPTHPGPGPGSSVVEGEDDPGVASQGADKLRPRILETNTGTPFLPLFTERSFVDAFRERMAREEDTFEGGVRSIAGTEGLGLADRLMQRGTIEGIIFNLNEDSELQVFHEEVKHLVSDKAVPLKQHLLGREVGEGNIQIVPPPERSVPEVFTETLQAYTRDQSDLASASWVWGVNPEVDNRPHLIINLETSHEDVDHEKHVQRLMDLLEGSIPKPGFVEVVFDKSWG